jgi:Family of unknown function (DUF6314)
MKGLKPVVTWPVRRLDLFLTGRWQIVRRILDRRRNARGHLDGTASFVSRDGGLWYEEAGQLILGGYRGDASRIYRFETYGGHAQRFISPTDVTFTGSTSQPG